MGVGNTTASQLLNYYYKGTAFTRPSTFYCALLSSAPEDDDDTTVDAAKEIGQPGQDGYSRLAISFGANASAGGSDLVIASPITFGPFTADLNGPATHVWIVDDSAYQQGTVTNHAAMTASRSVNTGDTVTFAAGELKFRL